MGASQLLISILQHVRVSVFAKVKKGESGMLAHLTFADDPDYIVDEL
jgi:hypothetical protein